MLETSIPHGMFVTNVNAIQSLVRVPAEVVPIGKVLLKLLERVPLGYRFRSHAMLAEGEASRKSL